MLRPRRDLDMISKSCLQAQAWRNDLRTAAASMRALGTRLLIASLIASDPSIEAALEPVKLFEGISKGGSDVGSRFAVQPLCLD